MTETTEYQQKHQRTVRKYYRYPQKWVRLNFDEVDEHRANRCKFEPECVLEAGIKQWQGFTCKYCTCWEKGGR